MASGKMGPFSNAAPMLSLPNALREIKVLLCQAGLSLQWLQSQQGRQKKTGNSIISHPILQMETEEWENEDPVLPT